MALMRILVVILVGLAVAAPVLAQIPRPEDPRQSPPSDPAPGSDTVLPGPGRQLIGQAIHDAISDRTLFGYNTDSGISWVEYYAPDGTAVYRMGGEVVIGVWEVVGERICFAYDNGRLPATYVYRVFRGRDRLVFTDFDLVGREQVAAIGYREEPGRSDTLDHPVRHGRTTGDLRRNLSCLAAQTS